MTIIQQIKGAFCIHCKSRTFLHPKVQILYILNCRYKNLKETQKKLYALISNFSSGPTLKAGKLLTHSLHKYLIR